MGESASLRELVDVDIVQAIQDSFAKTVGVSSVIFLPNGDALTRFSNPTKFCSLIQSTKEGRRRCFQSFTEMSRKAMELSEPEVMYCFAYGAHFVAPIIIDGERKATMYAGQFRPEKFSSEQLKELERIAVEIDLDPELLAREAKNMRTVGKDVVWTCLHSFFRTVKVIAELGAQAVELRQTKDALQNVHAELEIRMQKRTFELIETNEKLIREIAERKAADETLLDSEETLRSIVEQSGDGIVLTEGGVIIEWNRGQERITGLSRAEVLGRQIRDVRFRMAANDQDNPAAHERTEVVAHKIIETTIQRPDGSCRLIQASVFYIKTGKGCVTGTISRDITKRKRVEQELSQEKNLLKAISDKIPILFTRYDPNTGMLYLNKEFEKIVGWKTEEVRDIDLMEKMYPDPDYRKQAMEYMKKASTEWREFQVQSKSGKIINSEWSNIHLDDGTRISIGIDITERKAAEEQIKRSLREKDVLMREMHHRVKNNLQVVSSLLSMQARTTRNIEAINALHKSQSRINTMALIHTQLYKSGDLSELNMKEFIDALSGQLFRSYPVNDRKITPIIHVADRKFPVSVGVYIGLIINELLSNAIEHAFGDRKEGTIEVSLTVSDTGRVNLMVRDDGIGLPVGFDIDKTGSFGLRLVDILAKDQLQGTLEVINEGGATFNMEFDAIDTGGSSYGEDTNIDR